MTDVDTSIYKNIAPPPNLLQTYGQVVGIQNAQQQNRLLQQTQDLRAGMSQAVTAATDPTTGQLDPAKYQALTAADPRTAWNQGDITAQTQGNVTATANARIAQLNNAQAHIQAANGYIAANLGNPQLGVSDQYATIVKGINDMAAHGDSLMTPQERDAMIAQVPQGDPIAQKQFVLNAANQNFAAQKQIQPLIDQAYGTTATVNNGQQIQGGTQQSATRGGALTVQPGGVQTQTTPAENAALQPVWVKQPDGTYQQVQVPRSTLPGASGVAPPAVAAPGGNRLAAPAVPGGYLTTADASTASGPMGQQPPSTTNPGYNLLRGAMADNYAAPNMPPVMAGGGPTPPNATSGTVQTPPDTLPANAAAAGGARQPAAAAPILAAPPPGVTDSQNADITKYKADQAAIPLRQTNVQSLQKAQTALEALNDTALSTGKGTEGLNHLRSVITSLTGAGTASTMNYDEATKYLTDYARQQGAAANSDLQLQAAQGSNASTNISNAAALDVVKTNIGRERQAMAQVMAQSNPTGIGYGANAVKFASSTDPRGFAWNSYTAPEQQKIIGGLSPAGKTKLVNSLKIATQYGFTQPEGANAGQ